MGFAPAQPILPLLSHASASDLVTTAKISIAELDKSHSFGFSTGAAWLCGQSDLQMHCEAGASGECYEGIETELADTAAQQIV